MCSSDLQIVDNAQALIANTDAEAASLVSLYGAKPEKVHVIAPGVDLEQFSSAIKQQKEKLKISFVGRIQPHKGPEVLVRAAAEVIKLAPQLRAKLEVAIMGDNSGAGHDELTRLKISSAGCDVFSIDHHYITKPHWHYSAEERLILSGSGRFFIPTTDYLFVIDVVPGDLIWLSPCLQHWFETTSITAARYFSDDVAHIEQTDNLSDEVIKWNKQCFLTGFVPKL